MNADAYTEWQYGLAERTDMNPIEALFSEIEPAAREAAAGLPSLSHSDIAKYSIAISMKRLADFFAAFEARIEASVAMDGKSNGSEH